MSETNSKNREILANSVSIVTFDLASGYAVLNDSFPFGVSKTGQLVMEIPEFIADFKMRVIAEDLRSQHYLDVINDPDCVDELPVIDVLRDHLIEGYNAKVPKKLDEDSVLKGQITDEVVRSPYKKQAPSKVKVVDYDYTWMKSAAHMNRGFEVTLPLINLDGKVVKTTLKAGAVGDKSPNFVQIMVIDPTALFIHRLQCAEETKGNRSLIESRIASEMQSWIERQAAVVAGNKRITSKQKGEAALTEAVKKALVDTDFKGDGTSVL